jgi:hypothetical protein
MNLGFVNKRGFAQWVQEGCRHALRDARRLFCFLILRSDTAEVELGRVNCPGAKFLVNPKAAKVLRVRL